MSYDTECHAPPVRQPSLSVYFVLSCSFKIDQPAYIDQDFQLCQENGRV